MVTLHLMVPLRSQPLGQDLKNTDVCFPGDTGNRKPSMCEDLQ